MESTVLARIVALYEEQRAIWAGDAHGAWLSTDRRDRLVEIDEELEALWNKRRAEKAGVDPDSMPHIVVHERDNRHGPRFADRHLPALREREAAT